MPANQTDGRRANTQLKPFQFTLRSLLILTTLTAIFLSCLFSGPDWVAKYAVFLVVLAAPVVLITILVYGRGYQRTFCIGALTFVGAAVVTPHVIPDYYFFFLFDEDDPTASRCYALVGLLVGALTAAAFGLLAIWVRRMVEPAPSTPENRPDEPDDDDPQGPFA